MATPHSLAVKANAIANTARPLTDDFGRRRDSFEESHLDTLSTLWQCLFSLQSEQMAHTVFRALIQ
jgi:hypothetical protein